MGCMRFGGTCRTADAVPSGAPAKQDDRITGVDDWTFETGRKSVLVRFTVYTIYGELEATKEVEI